MFYQFVINQNLKKNGGQITSNDALNIIKPQPFIFPLIRRQIYRNSEQCDCFQPLKPVMIEPKQH
jgi:hypothetical protein